MMSPVKSLAALSWIVSAAMFVSGFFGHSEFISLGFLFLTVSTIAFLGISSAEKGVLITADSKHLALINETPMERTLTLVHSVTEATSVA